MLKLFDIPETPINTKNEWYTPSQYIEAAREVMGRIDLDPASCELANRTVKATRYYTQEDDGLAQEWYGNVWLNPPYGRKNAPLKGYGGGKSILSDFILKAVRGYYRGDITQAVIVAIPKTDTQWFQVLWQFPICFVNHRVLFHRPGKGAEGQFFGTIFVYLGSNEAKFIEVFSQFGTIAKRVN